MKESLKQFILAENGQGMVEYALIVAGIAIIIIVAIFALGIAVKNFYLNDIIITS